MTLTLVAVYAPHAVALRSHAPVPLGELLQHDAESGVLYSGMAKKAGVIVAVPAPLIAVNMF